MTRYLNSTFFKDVYHLNYIINNFKRLYEKRQKYNLIFYNISKVKKY